MGVIKTYEDQAFLDIDSSNEQAKGKSKKKEPKGADLNQQTSEGSSDSKKKKKKCPYCMRGFHLEDSCMKKNLDHMKSLCGWFHEDGLHFLAKFGDENLIFYSCAK